MEGRAPGVASSAPGNETKPRERELPGETLFEPTLIIRERWGEKKGGKADDEQAHHNER